MKYVINTFLNKVPIMSTKFFFSIKYYAKHRNTLNLIEGRSLLHIRYASYIKKFMKSLHGRKDHITK